MNFEMLETIQASKREAHDAAKSVIRSYKAEERHARRKASDRRARAAKVSAIGLAVALPVIAGLTAPASGVVEAADKPHRPAVVGCRNLRKSRKTNALKPHCWPVRTRWRTSK